MLFFPHRLNGRRYVIATAQATTTRPRPVMTDARGRRWLDVQVRARADDRVLATDRAFVDARGRILAMATALGRAAWGDVDTRRIAAIHRTRVHFEHSTSPSRRPPE